MSQIPVIYVTTVSKRYASELLFLLFLIWKEQLFRETGNPSGTKQLFIKRQSKVCFTTFRQLASSFKFILAV